MANKLLSHLKEKYSIIDRGHITSWKAWLVIGLVIGIVSGIFYVGNRTGKFDTGEAASICDTGAHEHASYPNIKQGPPYKHKQYTKHLQQDLMLLGYDLSQYGADGLYGSETGSAVKKFRINSKLPAGTQTTKAVWEALRKDVTTYCANKPKITITVISPNGGNKWVIGEKYKIIWKSEGLSEKNVRIALYPKNLTSKIQDIAVAVPATQGIYSWTIPSSVRGALNYYRVAIIYDSLVGNAPGIAVVDYSDNYFSISNSKENFIPTLYLPF